MAEIKSVPKMQYVRFGNTGLRVSLSDKNKKSDNKLNILKFVNRYLDLL